MTPRPTFAPARIAVVLAALAMGVCSSMGAAWAQPAAARSSVSAAAEKGPTWSSLTEAQRKSLTPLQGEWPRIDADRKQKWLELATRMPTMSPAEQSRVQVRMAEWARLSPVERGRARLQFQESRQLTSTDREERWRAYQSLPADQRQALAAKSAPTAAAKPALAAAPAQSAGLNTKKNTVPFLPAPRPKAVGPTIVQSRPGATTSLVTRPAPTPAHQQAGMPKIAATKGFVDPATLLPRRGPQGAAVAAAPANEKPASTHQ